MYSIFSCTRDTSLYTSVFALRIQYVRACYVEAYELFSRKWSKADRVCVLPDRKRRAEMRSFPGRRRRNIVYTRIYVYAYALLFHTHSRARPSAMFATPTRSADAVRNASFRLLFWHRFARTVDRFGSRRPERPTFVYLLTAAIEKRLHTHTHTHTRSIISCVPHWTGPPGVSVVQEWPPSRSAVRRAWRSEVFSAEDTKGGWRRDGNEARRRRRRRWINVLRHTDRSREPITHLNSRHDPPPQPRPPLPRETRVKRDRNPPPPSV